MRPLMLTVSDQQPCKHLVQVALLALTLIVGEGYMYVQCLGDHSTTCVIHCPWWLGGSVLLM